MMSMRYRWLGLLSMLLSFAAAAGGMPEITFPYGQLELRGYVMEMGRNGSFRIYSGSTIFVEGSFAVEGNRITISDSGGPYACRGKGMNPGSYYWTVHDGGLYLMLIEDYCRARRATFLEGPLKIRQTSR